MGFRFRKSIKIAPGVRINLSKKGVSSTSIGTKGATVNLNEKGAKTTVGVPGSGLSYETKRTGGTDFKAPGCITIFALLVGGVWLVRSCTDGVSSSAPSNAGWAGLAVFVFGLMGLVSIIALAKPLKFRLLNTRLKAGIALVLSLILGFITVGVLAVNDPGQPIAKTSAPSSVQ
ncbi:DUF4236 domain-containing protein [Asticcacaulis sp. AND118]|uniref:DUF4236 domain-containing protein n=1 Tax=Asticcacaulis sp. AND118 TaxID=2840468 RepID=UPI001CFFEB84|nr:DUF4236 domain-containing protein [Asticcacaulis sp. AND118]UDF02994.1 DUF4236 domain-containing protein [Asticcacaulis sp. AND118]